MPPDTDSDDFDVDALMARPAAKRDEDGPAILLRNRLARAAFTMEDRIVSRIKREWPAQVVATFSDDDLRAAGCDPDVLRALVGRTLGRRTGTDIVIALNDCFGRAEAILWRGKTLARGKRKARQEPEG